MHQSGAVRVPDAGAGLHHEQNSLSHAEAPALFGQSLEIRSRDVLHDQEQLAGIETEIMYGDNIGVG